MKPAMRMLAMEKIRQGEQQPRSEYGGNQNRRMIGYDRDANREHTGMTYNAMPHHPPMDTYGGEMNYNRMQNYGGVESRRQRDGRGRFAMADMTYDMDDEDYSPRSMRGSPQSRGGSSYGDVYAKGTIYAPGAMNRPSGGMMDEDMAEPVDEQTARMWVRKMSAGEHFKPEQAEQFRGMLCPHCEKWEWFVAINAMYSDHCETGKKIGVDRPEFYAHLAKDFLMDEDAGPHKLRKYMTTIPQK